MKLLTLIMCFLILIVVFRNGGTMEELNQVETRTDTIYTPIYGIKNQKWVIVDTSVEIKTTAIILAKTKK